MRWGGAGVVAAHPTQDHIVVQPGAKREVEGGGC